MKKLLALFFVLAISTQLFADIKEKHLIGKWKYTAVTDQGEMTGHLIFIEKEGKLSGEVNSDDGNSFPVTKIELKEGDLLYFEVKPEYDVIKVRVKVEGNKFKGSGSTYDGEFGLTGEKVE